MPEERTPVARRTPWHLWLVGVLGVLWNGVGVVDNAMTLTRNEAYLGRLGAEQLAALFGLPLWLVAVWTLAVWAGVAGAVLLLLRQRSAVPVLLVSLLAMAVTGLHNALSAEGLYATAGTGPVFVGAIFLVALGLWAYAWLMRERGVLV